MARIFAFARQRGLRSNSKGKFLRKLPLTPKIIKNWPSVKSSTPDRNLTFIYHLGWYQDRLKLQYKNQLLSGAVSRESLESKGKSSFPMASGTDLRCSKGRPSITESVLLFELGSICSTSHGFGLVLIFAFARQRGLRSDSKGKSLRKLPRRPRFIKNRPSVKSSTSDRNITFIYHSG